MREVALQIHPDETKKDGELSSKLATKNEKYREFTKKLAENWRI